MSDINISISGTKRLKTAGKYCDRDIVVTAEGGGSAPVIEPLEITENGTYTAPSGVDGYSPITVNVNSGGSGVNRLNLRLLGTLQEVTAEDFQDVTIIKDYSFYFVHGLLNVTIPDNVTSLGEHTFEKCRKLKSIRLSNSITSIGASVFMDCDALENIVVPKGVTSIATQAFMNCKSLQYCDFTSHTEVPTLANKSAFNYILSTCEIRVPMALATDWKAATNWSNHASKIVGVGFTLIEKGIWFTFRIGMTWEEFVNSDYNKGIDDNGEEYTPFYIDSGNVFYIRTDGVETCVYDVTSINDEIINGFEYYTDDY